MTSATSEGTYDEYANYAGEAFAEEFLSVTGGDFWVSTAVSGWAGDGSLDGTSEAEAYGWAQEVFSHSG